MLLLFACIVLPERPRDPDSSDRAVARVTDNDCAESSEEHVFGRGIVKIYRQRCLDMQLLIRTQ